MMLLNIAINLKYYKSLLNYATQLMDKEIKNKPIDLCKLGIDIAISCNIYTPFYSNILLYYTEITFNYYIIVNINSK